MDLNTGIADSDRKEIAHGLSRMLADTYTLYLKTHGYHWNVTGPMFRSLHLMFEEEYIELREAVDLIAERIRALGYPAPASYAEYATWVRSPTKRYPGPRWRWSVAWWSGTRPSSGRRAASSDRRSRLRRRHRRSRHDPHRRPEKTAWMLRSTASSVVDPPV